MDDQAKDKDCRKKLFSKSIEKWCCYCFDANLPSIFCGRLCDQSWQSLEDKMKLAAESLEAMQAAMERWKHPNALPVKQQQQVALIANLLFHMTRQDVKN